MLEDNPQGIWLSRDGRNINLRTKKIPLKISPSDEFSYVLGICDDVTASKEAEQKLIAASKMSLLGEMSGGIAHEINNPLAIINAKASQLKKRVQKGPIDVEKLIKDLEIIEETTYRIAKIIKGLRSFSRNTEKDPLVLESLSQVISDAISLCSERFKVHEILLTVDIDQDLNILCRSAEISQIIVNLLSNSYDAIEHLNDKWIKIEVREAGENVHVMVTDSGNGISKEIAQKIMFPFYTTKEVNKGTGLGLSISQGIAKKHNGRLYYDGTYKNTRFVLELPLANKRPLADQGPVILAMLE